ncbi:MAG: DNA primase DnaG [Candidatus Hodarchaeota archaeon]
MNGVAERSDVIGAIFGQTEGLLGEGLDLRELQKTSRIGRIVVKLQYHKSQRKTTGLTIVPSSLDRVETAILAASLETVNRVGPCVAKISLQKIEDVRESKRQQIVSRATSILRGWERDVAPESTSLIEEVVKQARVSNIRKYGSENLPAGPAIYESDAIIVVEGRADVLNLLKHGFRNVVAVQGTNIPKTVIELSKRKVVTAFLDGDRGGDLILKELLQVADIDFIARAPQSREVEDMTGKEIIKALRNKIPVEQIIRKEFYAQPPEAKIGEPDLELEITEEIITEEGRSTESVIKASKPIENRKKIPSKIVGLIDSLNTREAIVVDENYQVVEKVPVSTLRETLLNMEKVFGVIFDGIITQRLLDLSSEKKLDFIAGARIAEITKRPFNLEIYEFAT